MVTVVRATIPAEEFAMSHTLDTLSDLEFEVERIVDTGDQAVMPLLWVRGPNQDRTTAAFDEDTTINDVDLVATFDEERLYRVEWTDKIDLILQMLTNAKATILDAFGRDDRWKLRMLYPGRDRLQSVHDFCQDHGLTLNIESVRELDSEPAGRYGLTADQFDALTTAVEGGFYEVPRETELSDLAEEFDISHQALSERLRRATGALVEDTLLVGFTEFDDR